MKVRTANILIGSANILLILGIVAFSAASFVLQSPSAPRVDPPDLIRMIPEGPERADIAALHNLPNPLRIEEAIARDLVLLIGVDAIKNSPMSHTAYLYLVGRKVGVNAYVDEPIRDGSTGREISELSGWRLKRVISMGALFETPEGERTLKLTEIPARELAAVDARTQLKYAAGLYANGRVEEACLAFDEAFLLRPSHEVFYAFIMESGDEFMVSLMNSKNKRVLEIGYRLFELAKPGGERIRPRTANA